MISFAKEPFVVVLDDGTTAGDDGDILLLGVLGHEGLLLAAKKLEWYPLEKMTIVGQLVSDIVAEGEMIMKDAPTIGEN